MSILCLQAAQSWAAAPDAVTDAAAAGPNAVSVMFVSTDDFSSPYIASLYAGYVSTLRKQFGQRLTVYSENLQFAQFSDDQYRARLHDWLAQKYAKRDVKVVVAIGHAALDFLLEPTPGPLSEVPIVVVATTASALAKLPQSNRVTGMSGQFKLSDTVGLVKAMLPRTQHLALVGNQPERDDYRPFFAADLAALKKDIDFIDLRGMPFAELMARIANLPPETAIYFTRATVDVRGAGLSSQDVLEAVVARANQPVFVDNATSVGSGVVGGVVAEPSRRGREAAEITQMLVAGIPVSSLPVKTGVLTTVLDWRALQRWNIATNAAPRGSEIRFYQPSFWERYHWEASGVALFILMQFLTVLALLVSRRKREAAVQESHQRLREIAHMNRNTTATVYSAAIAHELNQPLSAILSNSEAAMIFLEAEPPNLAEVRDVLIDIRRDNLRATELIRSMRTLLKKSDTDPQVLDLNAIIKEVSAFLSSEIKMRQVTLITALHQARLPVLADHVQMQQVVINLVLNSMDAMESAGTERRFVTVRTSLGATREIELEVSDNGPGFESDLEEVFESFFTTKLHGMGLGLSITAAIVAAHGGRIAASNALRGGAIVSIRLPVVKEAAS